MLEAPAADVEEVRHGEWLENGANYKCSYCGNTEPYCTDNYCRVCGAKMKNIVYCKECKYLEISGCYGECGKAYRGIVNPDDSCGKGKRKDKKEKEK